MLIYIIISCLLEKGERHDDRRIAEFLCDDVQVPDVTVKVLVLVVVSVSVDYGQDYVGDGHDRKELWIHRFTVVTLQHLKITLEKVSRLAHEQRCRSQYCDPFVIHI